MRSLDRLCVEIEDAIQAAHRIAAGLTDEQFNQQPAGGGWSIAQCVAHLTLTFEQFEPRFKSAIAEGRSQGLTGQEPFRYSLFERIAIKGVEPPPSLRVKAPAPFVLSHSLPAAQVLSEFESAHRRFQLIIRSAEGLDLGRIRIAHPAISLWNQRLGAAFQILSGHCRSHLWQAARVREEILAPFAQPSV